MSYLNIKRKVNCLFEEPLSSKEFLASVCECYFFFFEVINTGTESWSCRLLILVSIETYAEV
jgi:hypothetical protein